MKPVKIFALAAALALALAACAKGGEPRPAVSAPGASAGGAEPYVYTGETRVVTGNREFRLEDIPENEAEDVLARNFLCEITQDFDALSAMWFESTANSISLENTRERAAQGKYMRVYVIHNIVTLTEEQYAQEPVTGYDPLYWYGLEEAIEEYDLTEFEVVRVTYTQTLSAQALAGGPQWGDGTYERSYLVGRAAAGEGYKLCEAGGV